MITFNIVKREALADFPRKNLNQFDRCFLLFLIKESHFFLKCLSICVSPNSFNIPYATISYEERFNSITNLDQHLLPDVMWQVKRPTLAGG